MHGSIREAIKKMDTTGSGLIPIYGNFPWGSTQFKLNLYANVDWKNIDVIDVEIKKLSTCQKNLETKKLLWRAENFPGNPVYIIKNKQDLEIADGHHRLAVSWLSGLSTFPAHVLGCK
jgi:hypothetical protein